MQTESSNVVGATMVAKEMLRRAMVSTRYLIVVITPETADTMLATKGRRTTGTKYARRCGVYARDMQANRWVFNGDPVIFDEEGNLLDGEARLRACIEAGVPFTTIVFYGVRAEAVATLGSHLKRTTSDVMKVGGEPYPQAVSNAWPLIVAYLNTERRDRYLSVQRTALTGPETRFLTDNHPGIRESAKHVSATGAGKVLGPGAGTALHYLMAMVDPEKADRFFEIVGKPSLDPESAPAVLSRRISAMVGRKGGNFRLQVTAKAWARYVKGQTIAPSGLVHHGLTEAFPVLDGIAPDRRIELVPPPVPDVRPRTAYEIADASANARMEIMIITPEMAALYLANNGPTEGGNRAIRRRQVDNLARDLRSRRWFLNGRPIKLSRDGRLLDGQHRCAACVKSGMPMLSFVVRDISSESFDTYDTGDKQGLDFHLKATGVKDASTVASAASVIMRVETGLSGYPTIGEGLDIVDRYPDLEAHVAYCKEVGMKDVLPVSVAAGLMSMFAQKAPEESRSFFDRVVVGDRIDVGHPVHTLRENLMKPSKRVRFQHADQQAKIVIKAWNATRRGEKVHRLDYDSGFPEIV